MLKKYLMTYEPEEEIFADSEDEAKKTFIDILTAGVYTTVDCLHAEEQKRRI